MLPQSQDEALSLARYILEWMDLKDLPLSVKARTQNWVFDTVMPNGEQAVIRLKAMSVPEGIPITLRRPEPRTKPQEIWDISTSEGVYYRSTCELYTLKTLTRKTTLSIPRVINSITHGLSELSIFSYVPGEPLTPQTLTLKDAARAGGFLAHLHNESRRLISRSPIDAQLNTEGLLGASSRYANTDEHEFLSADDREILHTLAEKLAHTEALLGPSSEHTLLIHGDYLLQNILFDGETVSAVDFEMCGWGTDLYDLATFLWQMKPHANYEKIADAFWKGYTFWRELPPREWLEVFIAARQGASVRWLIQNRHLPSYADRVPTLIRQRLDEISAFFETGILKRA